MEWLPLKLHPCYKSYLWGGTQLKTGFGKTDAPELTAESWELAAHRDGASVIEGGMLNGRTLGELGSLDRAGFWGSRCTAEQFPLLVKLIDAAGDLSVQVHPSDETANREQGEQGKAELWYIVDCKPQAYIYFGFSRKLSREEVERRAKDGSICEVLNRVPVKKGDVFYVQPGTIHAICAGILIAEIQQSSNTTFRVYDYLRKDSSGNPRELHLARALAVLDRTPVVPEKCRSNNRTEFPGFTLTELAQCPYFTALRLDVRTEVCLRCDGTSFHHLLCTDGAGELVRGTARFPIRKGDSYFIPAKAGKYTVTGHCRAILSWV